MKTTVLTQAEKDICAAVLWGGGITNASKEYDVSEDEVTQTLYKFNSLYQQELKKRGINDFMFEAKDQLKEEMLLPEEERTNA